MQMRVQSGAPSIQFKFEFIHQTTCLVDNVHVCLAPELDSTGLHQIGTALEIECGRVMDDVPVEPVFHLNRQLKMVISLKFELSENCVLCTTFFQIIVAI